MDFFDEAWNETDNRICLFKHEYFQFINTSCVLTGMR